MGHVWGPKTETGDFLCDYDYIPHQQGHTHGLLEATDSLEGYH